MSGTIFGGLAQFEGSYQVNRIFHVFLESVYRLLRSPVLKPSSNVSLFAATSGLNWGGFFFGGGVGAKF